MGYQPRKSIPRFVDENGKPIPPGVFTSQHDTREVYALFDCGDPATLTMAQQSYDSNKSTYVPPAYSPWYHDDILDPLRAILIDGMMSRPEPRSPQDVGCVDYDAL